MLSFRILGPLEVTDGQAAIALGGPRPARAARRAAPPRGPGGADRAARRRALRRRAAEEPRPRRCRTASSRCGRCSGRTSSLTRPPGYLLSGRRDQVDSGTLRGARWATRGARPPEERARCSCEALALWRGPPLAEFALRGLGAGRGPPARRASPCRRRGADRDRHRARAPRPTSSAELEALVGEQPLRERPARACSCSPSTAPGARRRRSRPTQSARARARRRARDRAGRGAPAAAGRDPAPARRRLATRPARPTAAGSRRRGRQGASLAGRVVPVLGLDGGSDLACELADGVRLPERPAARPRPRLAVRRDHERLGPALRRAAPTLRGGASSRSRCTASSPRLPPLLRERGAPHQLDRHDALRPRARAARSTRPARRSTSSRTSRTGRYRGKFWHRPPDEAPRPIDVPNTYATELSLDRRTDPPQAPRRLSTRSPEREWESFVVTEDDYIDYLGRSDLAAVGAGRARGAACGGATSSSSATRWSTGTSGSSCTASGATAPSPIARGRVDPEPTALERAFWRRFDVDVLDGRAGRVRRAPRATRLERRDVSLGVPIPRPRTVRGLRPRRPLLLRARARLRDRGREPASPRGSRCSTGRAASGSRRCSARASRVRLRAALRRSRSSSSSTRWGDDPAAGAGRDGRRRRRRPRATGSLVETSSTRAQLDRDVYLILDQAEEYFLYHQLATERRARRSRARGRLAAAGQRDPAVAPRGRSRHARPVSRALIPSAVRQRPPPRASRPRRRASGDRRARSSASAELDRRARRRSRPRSSRPSLDEVGSRPDPARSRRRAAWRTANGAARGSRRPYLQLVMRAAVGGRARERLRRAASRDARAPRRRRDGSSPTTSSARSAG